MALAFGTPQSYLAEEQQGAATAGITANTALIFYSTTALGSDNAEALVATISGTTLGFGTPLEIEVIASIIHGCAVLSSTRAVVFYSTSIDLLEISGTSLTLLDHQSISGMSGDLGQADLAVLDSTTVVIAYQSNLNAGHSRVVDLSGDSITLGSATAFDAGTIISEISVAALTSSKAVVTYRDGADSFKGKAITLDISGTTITPGTEAQFEAGGTYSTWVTAITASQAIVAYIDDDDSDNGKLVILNVSGTTITPGSPTTFEASAMYITRERQITIQKMRTGYFVLVYVDKANSSYGTAIPFTVSGSTITLGAVAIFENDSIDLPYIGRLSNIGLIVVYDNDGEALGYGVIGAAALDPARFYFGQGPGEGVLSEKFATPFPGVNPGAMTLNQSLGTVVIGADNPATEAVVYSTHPYVTGTAMSIGHPTGTSISSLKWI